MTNIPSSELILNDDGSIYHLGLHPEDIAETIITVGDPNRVERVSRHFDDIEIKKEKREFVTHTGRIGKKRLTVISTGIGTDNIDIVLNELDALVNIDLKSSTVKSSHRSLQLVRIGTSGGIRTDVPIGSIVQSQLSIGLDGLLHAYQRKEDDQLAQHFLDFCAARTKLYVKPYGAYGSPILNDNSWIAGITMTCPGFYGPQFRQLRLPVITPGFLKDVEDYTYEGLHLTNLEMETSGLLGMAQLLGHQATSISAILANRQTGQFVDQPKKIVNRLIESVLEKLEGDQ